MLLESLRCADTARPWLGEAVSILRRGGLVAFPTETVYGLGADGLNPAALNRIFEAKGRPRSNPLILHVSGLAMAQSLTSTFPLEALHLAEAFWPGPLTLVLPKRALVPNEATAGGPTVALRMPDHPVALSLIRAFGGPVAAPSANRSEHVSPTCAEHVLADLEGRIDLLLDGGPCDSGLESTVVDLSGKVPRILRPGPLPPAALAAVLGSEPQIHPHISEVAKSPGQALRHYAPRIPVILRRDSDPLPHLGPLGWMRLTTPITSLPQATERLDMPVDPREYGRQLYVALRELERHSLQAIVVDLPPDTAPWHAVRDRLIRAAAPPWDARPSRP